MTKGNFKCAICIPYLRWAITNNQPHSVARSRKATTEAILKGTAELAFSGLVQVQEHSSSKCHREACQFWKRDRTNHKACVQDSQEGSFQNKKDYGRLLGGTSESFKLLTTSESQIQSSRKEKVRCYYLWDPEVVKEFPTDLEIRRITPKKLFQEQLKNGIIRCSKDYPDHAECWNYKEWKGKHPVEVADLKQEAQSKTRSMFIGFSKDVVIHGKAVHI